MLEMDDRFVGSDEAFVNTELNFTVPHEIGLDAGLDLGRGRRELLPKLVGVRLEDVFDGNNGGEEDRDVWTGGSRGRGAEGLWFASAGAGRLGARGTSWLIRTGGVRLV